MGLDRITQKLQEALQSGQSIASKSSHPELKSIHVLLALLQQEGGITVPILQKAGIDISRLKAAVASALTREPSVQGASTQPQISVGLRATLDSADKARESLGDDYLSVEHFILGSLEGDSPAGKLLKDAGVDQLVVLIDDLRPSRASADLRKSPTRIPRGNIRHWKNTAPTSPPGPEMGKSIPSSAATTRSAACCKSFPAAPRTTRCSSASPASEKPPSSKASRDASFPVMCRIR